MSTLEQRYAAFKRELESHRVALLPFARAICKDPDLAEDMVQDTLFKSLKKWESFQPGTNMKAWLFLVLRNHYYSHLRKQRCRKALDEAFSVQNFRNHAPASQNHACELADILHALGELPLEQRTAIMHIGLEGRNYEETAAMEGVKIGTIKSRVSRGRSQLRLMEAY